MNGQLNMYPEYFIKGNDCFGTTKANEVVPNLEYNAFPSTTLTNRKFKKLLQFDNLTINKSEVFNGQLQFAIQHNLLPMGPERKMYSELTKKVEQTSSCLHFRNQFHPQSIKDVRQNFVQNQFDGEMGDGIMGTPEQHFTPSATIDPASSAHKFRNKNWNNAGTKLLMGQNQSGGSVNVPGSPDNRTELSYIRRGPAYISHKLYIPPQPPCIIKRPQIPPTLRYISQNQHLGIGQQYFPNGENYSRSRPPCIPPGQFYIRSGPPCIREGQFHVRPGPIYFRPGQSYYHSGKPYRCVSSYSREEPSFSWTESSRRQSHSRPTVNKTRLTHSRYELNKDQLGSLKSQLVSTKGKSGLSDHLPQISKSRTGPRESTIEDYIIQKHRKNNSRALNSSGHGKPSCGYEQSSFRNKPFSSRRGPTDSCSKSAKELFQEAKEILRPTESNPQPIGKNPQPIGSVQTERISGPFDRVRKQTKRVPCLTERVPGPSEKVPTPSKKVLRTSKKIPRSISGPPESVAGPPESVLSQSRRQKSSSNLNEPLGNRLGPTANQPGRFDCIPRPPSSRPESKESRSSSSNDAYCLEINPAEDKASTISSKGNYLTSEINKTVHHFPIEHVLTVNDCNDDILDFALLKHRSAVKCTSEFSSQSLNLILQETATLSDKQEQLLRFLENSRIHLDTIASHALKVF